MEKRLLGTNLTIVQSLIVSLNQAAMRVDEIRQALDETIEKLGNDLLGHQEGQGRFALRQERDGGFSILWDASPPETIPPTQDQVKE